MRRFAILVTVCGACCSSWATAAPFDQLSSRLQQYDDSAAESRQPSRRGSYASPSRYADSDVEPRQAPGVAAMSANNDTTSPRSSRGKRPGVAAMPAIRNSCPPKATRSRGKTTGAGMARATTAVRATGAIVARARDADFGDAPSIYIGGCAAATLRRC